ncbi:MAG TPA: tetratricopeptide repeat protein [Pyrinomonadaceae bacterium]|nr:tetratricopeptide repeat protein [Pyrinomonadaceae bacterium]
MKFTQTFSDRVSGYFLLVFLLISVLTFSNTVKAQNEDLETLKAKVAVLLDQDKVVEALPLLEKIVAAEPKDANSHFYLGFALLGKAINTADKEEKKALKVRARNEFIKSRDLGKNDNIVLAFIQSIPPDGSEPKGFSDNEEANKLMEDGEKAFTEGQIDAALAAYQKAFKLDPKIYEAALFTGDMFVRKEDFANAEIWYQKAITINPDRETAYRYSATPLMRQQKYDLARDRYIEAFICDPFSRFSLNGMLQWGQATNTKLAHPRIDVPKTEVGADGKMKTTINVNPLADDGSMAWIGYTTVRNDWRDTKFAKTFPSEKTYRHSLQEEAEALRNVVTMAKTFKGKNKNPQIETIAKLDQEGFLEAYILLALTDQGIADDYADYFKANRAKLRQYVLKYVVNGGK